MYVEVKKDHQIKIKKKASNPKITKQIIKMVKTEVPEWYFQNLTNNHSHFIITVRKIILKNSYKNSITTQQSNQNIFLIIITLIYFELEYTYMSNL